MGRIVTPVEIKNVNNPEYRVVCDALVDTGSSYMVLPTAWNDKLGDIEIIDDIEVEILRSRLLS